MKRATGSFEVSLKPLSNAEVSADVRLGRMLLTKKFNGDLSGSARGQMLSAMTAIKGSAGYVAIDHVTAELDGRRGSFLLQHSGAMNRGVPSLSIMVVPDSGTDELAGLSGTLSVNIIDGKHFYDFITPSGARGALQATVTTLTDTGERDATSMLQPRQATAGLLAHPSVWRGEPAAVNRSHRIRRARCRVARRRLAATWPRKSSRRLASARLYLLLPVLAALSRATPARWCTWVSPPHEPFAPALEAHGVALDRMLIVRCFQGLTPHDGKRRRSDGVHMGLWALEQALRSGACGMALAWLPRASPRAIRRLQLAAEQGRTLGVLYRSQRFAHLASPAMLRVLLENRGKGGRYGARLRLLQGAAAAAGPSTSPGPRLRAGARHRHASAFISTDLSGTGPSESDNSFPGSSATPSVLRVRPASPPPKGPPKRPGAALRARAARVVGCRACAAAAIAGNTVEQPRPKAGQPLVIVDPRTGSASSMRTRKPGRRRCHRDDPGCRVRGRARHRCASTRSRT